MWLKVPLRRCSLSHDVFYLNHALFIFQCLLILLHLTSTSRKTSIQIKFYTSDGTVQLSGTIWKRANDTSICKKKVIRYRPPQVLSQTKMQGLHAGRKAVLFKATDSCTFFVFYTKRYSIYLFILIYVLLFLFFICIFIYIFLYM